MHHQDIHMDFIYDTHQDHSYLTKDDIEIFNETEAKVKICAVEMSDPETSEWIKWSKNYEEYIEKYQKLPKPSDEDKEKTELYLWFDRNLTLNLKCSLKESLMFKWRVLLGTILDLIRCSKIKVEDEEWLTNFRSLFAFVVENDRLPTQNEPKLFSWLERQKFLILTEHLPSRYNHIFKILVCYYQYLFIVKKRQLQKLQLITNFVKANDRLPIRKMRDETEKILAEYLCLQCKQYKSIKLESKQNSLEGKYWFDFVNQHISYFQKSPEKQHKTFVDQTTTLKITPKQKSKQQKRKLENNASGGTQKKIQIEPPNDGISYFAKPPKQSCD